MSTLARFLLGAVVAAGLIRRSRKIASSRKPNKH